MFYLEEIFEIDDVKRSWILTHNESMPMRFEYVPDINSLRNANYILDFNFNDFSQLFDNNSSIKIVKDFIGRMIRKVDLSQVIDSLTSTSMSTVISAVDSRKIPASYSEELRGKNALVRFFSSLVPICPKGEYEQFFGMIEDHIEYYESLETIEMFEFFFLFNPMFSRASQEVMLAYYKYYYYNERYSHSTKDLILGNNVEVFRCLLNEPKKFEAFFELSKKVFDLKKEKVALFSIFSKMCWIFRKISLNKFNSWVLSLSQIERLCDSLVDVSKYPFLAKDLIDSFFDPVENKNWYRGVISENYRSMAGPYDSIVLGNSYKYISLVHEAHYESLEDINMYMYKIDLDTHISTSITSLLSTSNVLNFPIEYVNLLFKYFLKNMTPEEVIPFLHKAREKKQKGEVNYDFWKWMRYIRNYDEHKNIPIEWWLLL